MQPFAATAAEQSHDALRPDGMAWRFPAACDAQAWRREADAELAREFACDAWVRVVELSWMLRQVDSTRAARLARRGVECAMRYQAEHPLAALGLGYARLVLAEAAWLGGDLQAARDALEEAAAAFGAVRAPRALSDLHWLASQLTAEAGDHAARDEALAASLGFACEAGDDLRRAYGELAQECVQDMDETGPSARMGAANALARTESHDAGVRMLAHLLLLGRCRSAHDAPGMVAHGEQARLAALCCGQWRRAILVGCNIGLDLIELQEFDEALASLEKTMPLARRCGWPLPLAAVLQAMAECLVQLQRPQAALNLVREAAILGERLPLSRTTLLVLITLGESLLALPDDVEEAGQVYLRLRDAARAAHDEGVLPCAEYGLARVAQARGQWVDAWTLADSALQRSLQAGDLVQAILCLRLQAALVGQGGAALPGPTPTARELLERAHRLACDASPPAGQHELSAELAAVCDAAGAHDAAACAWQNAYEAIKSQRGLDLVRRAAALEVRLRTGIALHQARVDRERAHAERQRAAELHQLNAQLGAAMTELRQTQQLLLQKNQALAEAHQRLSEVSLTDPLTRLHNRRHFDAIIERCAAEALATDPYDEHGQVLFFMIDLDHFKAVNDRHGHAAGDAVLVQMGERLRAVARPQDHLMRWGGEEFLLLLRSVSRSDAASVARRLLRAVSDTPFDLPDGSHLEATCSVGFCAFPVDPQDPGKAHWRDALALADARLYEAKRAGRNRAVGPG